MGAVRRGSVHHPLSEINVTPFVDVMLVLLIIFMVTAPMMQQGVDVDLPETTTQPIRVQDEPLILTVKKDGKVHVGRREIPQAELLALPATGHALPIERADEIAARLDAFFRGTTQ